MLPGLLSSGCIAKAKGKKYIWEEICALDWEGSKWSCKGEGDDSTVNAKWKDGKGNSGDVEVAMEDRTMTNGFTWRQGRFQLNIRKNFLVVQSVQFSLNDAYPKWYILDCSQHILQFPFGLKGLCKKGKKGKRVEDLHCLLCNRTRCCFGQQITLSHSYTI